MTKDELVELLCEKRPEGINLVFSGKAEARHIVRKVRPRAQRMLPELSVGTQEDQADNLLMEGENLMGMVSLHKLHGAVDLIIADPPYNTGNDFRYNDKWNEDPNDPEPGDLVTREDLSRYTKWMRFMLPRLQMMRTLLKPEGVLAICIDHRELFRLGLLLNEVFGEENRLAVINWQKTYSPKPAKHVSTATEYVLVYANDIERTKTGRLPRDQRGDSRFTNIDGDPEGDWRAGDPFAPESRTNTIYGIQSPFTGMLHYPEAEYRFDGIKTTPTRHWTGISKPDMKALLEGWGSLYEWRHRRRPGKGPGAQGRENQVCKL